MFIPKKAQTSQYFFPRHPVAVQMTASTKPSPVYCVTINVFVQDMLEAAIFLSYRAGKFSRQIVLGSNYRLIEKVSPQHNLFARFGYQVDKLARVLHVIEDSTCEADIELHLAFL